MYIGSTGPRGLHHLVYEVVDNSVDEALAGHCTEVAVTIHPDNSVTVVDDGRGIPVAIMEKEQRPAVEVVLTVLHAGGKFGDGGGYKVSGGLHGVGVSVVNALSERLDVEIAATATSGRRPTSAASRSGELDTGEPTSETGTTITFLPDAEIFETLEFDFTTLEERMRETAFLTRGLKHLARRRARRRARASSSSTTAGSSTSSPTSTRTRSRSTRRSSRFEGESDEGAVEVAMQWNASYQESVFSFANNINTRRGRHAPVGVPLGADRRAQPLRADKGSCKEKDESLTGEDVREGLTAVISAKLTDPQFEGQTKTKLGNPGMAGFVQSVVNARLAEFLEENPRDARAVIQKAVRRRRRARPRARRAT